jgi:Fe-Mn family superoxide dismutase
MAYGYKSFEHLIGLPGFSEDMLCNHLTLYQGYVTNTNTLLDLSHELIKADRVATPEFAETRRRLGWEWNGMRLHEYYFDGLTKESAALAPSSTLATAMAHDFGSVEAWEKDFKGIATMRGIGWAVLFYDHIGHRLINVWINEHNINHLIGANPILILDVFEHAFMMDYGIKRVDYVTAFFKAIDWRVSNQRFETMAK